MIVILKAMKKIYFPKVRGVNSKRRRQREKSLKKKRVYDFYRLTREDMFKVDEQCRIIWTEGNHYILPVLI